MKSSSYINEMKDIIVSPFTICVFDIDNINVRIETPRINMSDISWTFVTIFNMDLINTGHVNSDTRICSFYMRTI